MCPGLWGETADVYLPNENGSIHKNNEIEIGLSANVYLKYQYYENLDRQTLRKNALSAWKPLLHKP